MSWSGPWKLCGVVSVTCDGNFFLSKSVCVCACVRVCEFVSVLEQNSVLPPMRGFGLRFPHFNFANGVQVDVKTMRAILVLVVTTESLNIILLEMLGELLVLVLNTPYLSLGSKVEALEIARIIVCRRFLFSLYEFQCICNQFRPYSLSPCIYTSHDQCTKNKTSVIYVKDME